MKLKTGKLITFEGPEGSGKSTQIKRVASLLRKKGYSVMTLREPGGTSLAEEVRNILLHQRTKLSAEVETYLFWAARRDLVEKRIMPALRKGKVVLCDRFQDSTWVYQVYAGQFSEKVFQKAAKHVTFGMKPAITFVLDIPVKHGLSRSGRTDRMEKKPVAFHNKVRQGYLSLAKKEKKRCVIIDSSKDIETVFNEIKRSLERVL